MSDTWLWTYQKHACHFESRVAQVTWTNSRCLLLHFPFADIKPIICSARISTSLIGCSVCNIAARKQSYRSRPHNYTPESSVRARHAFQCRLIDHLTRPPYPDNNQIIAETNVARNWHHAPRQPSIEPRTAIDATRMHIFQLPGQSAKHLHAHCLDHSSAAFLRRGGEMHHREYHV